MKVCNFFTQNAKHSQVQRIISGIVSYWIFLFAETFWPFVQKSLKTSVSFLFLDIFYD